LLIAHMSDVHLGARKYGERAIYDDVFRAFEESLEAVAREHAEALVLAGDVFDSPHPDNNTLVTAVRMLKSFTSRGIKVVAAHGEHDTPGRREASALSIMSEAIEGFAAPSLLGANVSQPQQVVDIMTVRLGGAAFLVYPFFKVSVEERRKHYSDLRPFYDAAARRLRGDGIKAVFVAHIPVDPVFRFPSETVTSVNSFPRVNYVALGHIHSRTIGKVELVDGALWYAYPGSIYPLDLEEARLSHRRGPLLIDLSGDEASVQEVPVQVREHFVVPVTVKEPNSAYYDMKAALSKVSGQGGGPEPLVHLEVTAMPGVPTRLIAAEASRLSRELNMLVIPHVRRAEEEEGEARELRREEGRIDVVKLMQEIVENDEFTARAVLELAAAAAEGDEESVDSTLEKLASWQRSLDILRRLSSQ